MALKLFITILYTVIFAGLSPVLAGKSVQQLLMAANGHHHLPDPAFVVVQSAFIGLATDVVVQSLRVGIE
jgi:hypothetical protein